MTSYLRSVYDFIINNSNYGPIWCLLRYSVNIGADSQFSTAPPLFDAPWRRTPSKFPNDL